jgi:hypothetical protein
MTSSWLHEGSFSALAVRDALFYCRGIAARMVHHILFAKPWGERERELAGFGEISLMIPDKS